MEEPTLAQWFSCTFCRLKRRRCRRGLSVDDGSLNDENVLTGKHVSCLQVRTTLLALVPQDGCAHHGRVIGEQGRTKSIIDSTALRRVLGGQALRLEPRNKGSVVAFAPYEVLVID